MRNIFIVIFFEIVMVSCFHIHKSDSNNMDETIQIRQVNNFAEIPSELFIHIETMGIDSSAVINRYEGEYLNFIFKMSAQDFNLIGKKVYFNRSKVDFFSDERERYYYDYMNGGVGGTTLYVFNTTQKERSGGYDAAIIYWSKFILPTEKVINNIKNRH